MGIKLYIYFIIFFLLSAAIAGAVWYYKWSQAEIQVLRENNIKLVIGIKQNEETIKVMQVDAKRVGEQIVIVNKDFEKARKENFSLREKLSKHNIAYLAASKPKLIGKILTKGTKDAERCFEILSGAELTEAEKAATKKSQANSSCPSLANPNYEVRP